MNRYADGLIYGVKIPRYSVDQGMLAVKTDANVGLVLNLSSNDTIGRNDYLNKKLFMCPRVNGGVDSNGMPYVTAIEGIDVNFDCKKYNTWALTPVYYIKYTETDQYTLKQFSDTHLDGFEPCAGAKTLSGRTRPYILRACYTDGENKFASKSGTRATEKVNYRDVSYSGNSFKKYLQKSIERADGLSYLCYGDQTYMIDFMQLMFGVKAPSSIVKGFTRFGMIYNNTTQISAKREIAKSPSMTINNNHIVMKNYTLTNMNYFASGQVGYVGQDQSPFYSKYIFTNVNFNSDSQTIEFDLIGDEMPPTDSTYLIIDGVLNGYCDNIKGTCGAPNIEAAQNLASPFKFQNIEYCHGTQEICINAYGQYARYFIIPSIKNVRIDNDGNVVSGGIDTKIPFALGLNSRGIGDISRIYGLSAPQDYKDATIDSYNAGFGAVISSPNSNSKTNPIVFNPMYLALYQGVPGSMLITDGPTYEALNGTSRISAIGNSAL